MKNLVAALALIAGTLAVPATTIPATAQTGQTQLGVLDCLVEGGAGFIIGSTKDVRCTFKSTDPSKAPEAYFGAISKWGLDIGVTGTAIMQWVVLAPTNDVYAPGTLAGDYVGASADASAGVGVGANLLVGGSGRSFTLQPVSVQAQTGVNIALGVSRFELRSLN